MLNIVEPHAPLLCIASATHRSCCQSIGTPHIHRSWLPGSWSRICLQSPRHRSCVHKPSVCLAVQPKASPLLQCDLLFCGLELPNVCWSSKKWAPRASLNDFVRFSHTNTSTVYIYACVCPSEYNIHRH